jgi:hypothetical protein
VLGVKRIFILNTERVEPGYWHTHTLQPECVLAAALLASAVFYAHHTRLAVAGLAVLPDWSEGTRS